MVNQNNVENSIKIGHSTFDVVAVPQTNISQILDTTTDTIAKPVNIKIRMRNKGEVTEGLISVPKLTTTGPKKVRLVSSDQTIVSFDIFMETENEKKARKKPNYTFFKLFKPSACFNNQNDDDIYPYIPSSSNERYRAKGVSNVNDLQDDKIYDEKFALRKSLSPVTSSNISIRTPTFLGKCKPGGCLDPPFGEDKYIYKPKNKMLAIDKINIEKHKFDEKCIEDTKNTDEVADKPDIVLHDSSSKSAIEETYSHSLITYPPALFSSGVSEENQNKKSKLRNSSENKVRISINEFSETYFMPPKKQKNMNDEKLSIDTDQMTETRNRYDKTVTDSFTQKESILLPKNELFNQADHPTRQTEPKLLSTQYINESSQKITENNFSIDDDAIVGISESSSTNLKIKISKSKISISDVRATELTENYNAETKTDANLFETNLDSNVITTSTKIYKDTMITQNATTIAKESRISKNRSKSILDELKLKSNNLVDNILQTSRNQNKSVKENQPIGSSFLVNTDENEIKSAMHSDEVTLTNSNTSVIKHSLEIDNLHPVTESVELKHSNGKLNQIKESDPSKISIKEERQIKKITDTPQEDFQQNVPLQDVISTAVITNEKESDIFDIMSIKKDPLETEDEKYSDQDNTTFKLSEADDVQMADYKSIRISRKGTNAVKDSVMDVISAQPNESDKVSNDLSNNLRTGINIDIYNDMPTPGLQEMISSTLQLRQNSNNIDNEYKQFSSVTRQNVKQTSSRNSSTPLALPDKTSSYKRYSLENDPVKYKKSSAADRILLPSLHDVSDRTVTPSDNLEVHEPTDIVHDFISINNVSVEIQSFDDHHDLNTKVNLSEKERSDDKGNLNTKTELQIKNSKITLLSDYQTSVTPTDYSKVNGQSDIAHGLSPASNVLDEIQSSQNIDNENLHDLSIKDRLTEKEKSKDKETLETKPNLQIDNSTSSLISDYKVSATPILYQEVQRSADIVNDFIPTYNVPLEIQTLQNSVIENLHDLLTKDKITEKEESHDRETLEIKTELQINNSKVTLPSDYKTSATPTKFLEGHGTGDIVTDGLTPITDASVEIHNLQNIDIENRHDLSTKDHLTEEEEPDHKENLDTKTELQINNNHMQILSDYKTSSHYEHDTLDTSDSKKVENQYKLLKVDSDFYKKALDLYIPKAIPAHLEETLMRDDEMVLTKPKGKNSLQNKTSSIAINLGFHSFVNNKNETLIRTFDTSKDLRVDTQDKNVTIIKSIIRKNDSEIRIPVNSEIDLTLQIKKTFSKVSGLISKRDIDSIKKESTHKDSINTSNKDVLLQETLHSVYENLVPVENIIQNLKQEADFLTQQQVLFREILSTMKTTSQRIINKNKSCTCNK